MAPSRKIKLIKVTCETSGHKLVSGNEKYRNSLGEVVGGRKMPTSFTRYSLPIPRNLCLSLSMACMVCMV